MPSYTDECWQVMFLVGLLSLAAGAFASVYFSSRELGTTLEKEGVARVLTIRPKQPKHEQIVETKELFEPPEPERISEETVFRNL